MTSDCAFGARLQPAVALRGYSRRMPADFDVNSHDVFLLRQRWTMVINRYVFSLPDAQGKEGQPIAFVEQKRFKFKEDIRFYTDDTKKVELLRIKARQRFDPAARYDITGPGGEKVARFRRCSAAVCSARRTGCTTRTASRPARPGSAVSRWP